MNQQPDNPIVDAMMQAMQSGSAVLVVMGPPRRRGADHIDPQVIEVFDTLLAELDTQVITRDGWNRLKAILVEATLSAGDAESGARGFKRIEGQWPKSRYYDGKP